LTSGVLLLLGRCLVMAELAEVVIIAIVFSFIKLLCCSLTLSLLRGRWCGMCSLLKLTCCRLTLAITCRCRKLCGAHTAFNIGLMKALSHILIMIRHTIAVVWIVLPCHILVSKMPTSNTVEIVDVDIDVVTV